MAYRIIFEKRAEKDLKKIERKFQKKIVEKIEALQSNPRLHDAQKMTNSIYWKYRVGNFRIIYQIEDIKLTVIILKIGDRKEVYRKR